MREFFEGLSRRATIAGGQRAIIAPECSLSYGELFECVRSVAQWANRLPQRVGLLSGKTPGGIVSDLALSFAGKELVPLPAFFSDTQLSHIIRTAQLSHAVCDPNFVERTKSLGLIVCEPGAESTPGIEPATDTSRIIFTSGTTGQPKGVRLSGRQIKASVAALAQATGANAADRYLSLLPSSLLLEQIAGIYVPLSVGAEIHLPRGWSGSSNSGSIAVAAEQANATATVLVPELLATWLHELQALGRSGPASLRYVAVGGAPVSKQLAIAAWELGVPVHEGYGLSECCSVVTVNRPGDRRAGTVGRPLPGVNVTIENGEIVVSGPTVMGGYLTESKTIESWRTGDAGNFDPDGFLIVTGRKDNVIVTSAGRNIHPEWIEETVVGDHRIKRCVVVEYESELVAVVIPDDASMCRDWPAMQDLVEHATREVPDYAKPRRYLALSDQEFNRLDLLTSNFRPRRGAIRRLVSDWSHFLSSQSM
jgi:long-subunit acyl-CoA synthetase (AMP-forming)